MQTRPRQEVLMTAVDGFSNTDQGVWRGHATHASDRLVNPANDKPEMYAKLLNRPKNR
jgi:hypothetical protein